MTVRVLRDSDIPELQEMARKSGYPYPDLADPLIESVLVVADEQDRPIMACAAKRLIEMYLWCGKTNPHEGVAALRLLHEAMGEVLQAKAYNSVEAFLPPNVSGKFGRRMEKTFGWVRNWQSWTRRIEDGKGQ